MADDGDVFGVNAEISATLSLGVPTAKTQVSRILTKLNLNNRVQMTLATFAAMGVPNFDALGAYTSLVHQATVQNADAENNGTLSAWYVFAAIGLFPQTPGRAELLVGSPLFPKVELRRSNGVRLTIEAPETSDANQYVHSLTLNGKPRAESWLPESFITHGGRISARMGAAPSGWGTAPAVH